MQIDATIETLANGIGRIGGIDNLWMKTYLRRKK